MEMASPIKKNYRPFGYVVTNRQGYVPDANGLAGPVNPAANIDPNNTHFTIKGADTGGPDAVLYPTGTLALPALDIICSVEKI
jgi:hypothetical protein